MQGMFLAVGKHFGRLKIYSPVLITLIAALYSNPALAQIDNVIIPNTNIIGIEGQYVNSTQIVTLKGYPPGKSLISISNGNSGPQFARQCGLLEVKEEKRQCEYDNIVEKMDSDLSRVQSFSVKVSNRTVTPNPLMSHDRSLFKGPISLTNGAILSTQLLGYPTSHLSYSVEAYPSEPMPPIALFTASTITRVGPGPIAFKGRYSIEPRGTPLYYMWTFGDGGLSTEQNPTHIYNQPGTYEANLTVKNSSGLSDSLSVGIVVKPPPPPGIPAPPPSDLPPRPQMTVTFPDPSNLRKVHVSAAGSFDPDGFITSYLVNFGDGKTGIGPEIDHIYSADNTYLIQLKETDQLGKSTTISHSTSVSSSANFAPINSVFSQTFTADVSAPDTFTATISTDPHEASSVYRITVTNADGLDHPIATCNGNAAQINACQYRNTLARNYITLSRISSATLWLNNKQFTDGSSITSKVAKYQGYLKLSGSDKLKVKLNGWPGAYFKVNIEKMVPVEHLVPPTISSPIADGSILGNPIFHVSVNSWSSNVTTTINVDNNEIVKTKAQEFDYQLNSGANHFVIKSVDELGNSTTKEYSSVYLVTSGPSINTSVQDNTSTRDNNIQILVTALTAVHTNIIQNGQLILSTDDTAISFPLSQGINQFTIQSIDSFGFTSYQTFNNLLVDSISPILRFSHTDFSSSKSDIFHVSVTDASQVHTTILKDGAIATESDSSEFDFRLSQGSNALQILAVDALGNSSQASFFSISVDSINPLIVSNADGLASINTPNLDIHISDASATNTLITVNGSTLEPSLLSDINVPLNQGSNQIIISSTDSYTNNSTKIFNNLFVDSIAPVISTSSEDQTGVNDPKFTISVSDTNGAHTEVLINGSVVAQTDSNQLQYSLTEGQNQFLIRARDPYNNISTKAFSNLILDTTPPVISTSSQDNKVIGTSQLEVNIQSKYETHSEVIVGDKTIQTSDNAHFTIALSEGLNSITIRSTDKYSLSSIKTFANLRVDTTKPIISNIDLGLSENTDESGSVSEYLNNPTQTISASLLGDQYTSIDPNSFSASLGGTDVTSSFTLKDGRATANLNIPQGAESLVLTVSNSAGSTTTSTIRFVADFTKPTIVANLLDQIVLQTLRPQLNFSVNDLGSGIDKSTIQLLANGVDITSDFTVNSSGLQGTPKSELLQGANTIQFSVKDRAGNQATLNQTINLGIQPITMSSSPSNGAMISDRQPQISIFYSGQFIDLSSLVVKLNNTDITSALTITSTGAVYVPPSLLALGTNSLSAHVSQIKGASTDYSATFTVFLPAPTPNPAPTPAPVPAPVTTTIDPNNVQSVAIQDNTSPAYGAVATFNQGSILAATPISISVATDADKSTMPHIAENPQIGTFGPIIKFEPSMKFNELVTVGVPFDVAQFNSKHMSKSDLVVLRYDEQSQQYQTITPFSVDLDKGVMYIVTPGFSWFTGGNWIDHNFIHNIPSGPSRCIQIQSGKYCETTSNQITISGTIDSSLIKNSTSLQIDTSSCPGAQTPTISAASIFGSGSSAHGTQSYSVNVTLSANLQDCHIYYSAGYQFTRDDFTFSVIPTIPAAPSACLVTGNLCSVAGTSTNGVSADGVVASRSPISLYIPQTTALGSIGEASQSITHDSQGRILWAELTNKYPLGSSNKIEIAVRRLGLSGLLETYSTFTLNAVQGSNQTITGAIINSIEMNVPGSDNFVLINILDLETTFFGSTSSSTAQTRTIKLAPNGTFSTVLSTNNNNSGVQSSISSGPNGTIYFYADNTFLNTGNNGLFQYSTATNTYSFMGGLPNTAANQNLISPDGTAIANYESFRIRDIAYYNGEIYFAVPSQYCIRKFDSSLKVRTVAGTCNYTYNVSGEGISATSAHLGQIVHMRMDTAGNIFFSESNPFPRIRVVRSDNQLVQTIVGGGNNVISTSSLPLAGSNSAIPDNQQTGFSNNMLNVAITNDLQGNLYAAIDNFIVKIQQPAAALPVTPPSLSNSQLAPTTSLASANFQLTNNTFLQLLDASQSQDGYWSFDQSYLGTPDLQSDSELRLLATEKALEAYSYKGSLNSASVGRAINWVANQSFSSTSMLARQLKLLSRFANADTYGGLQVSTQSMVQELGTRYRPPFFGWGSDAKSVTNNLDTAEAIDALAVANASTTQPAGYWVQMSTYQSSVVKLMAKQFSNFYGDNYSGGFSLSQQDFAASPLVTCKVIDALVSYSALNQNNTAVIDAGSKSDFITLKTVSIPRAIGAAVLFLKNRQSADGSYGSISETILVGKTMSRAISSGLVPSANLTSANAIVNQVVSYLGTAPLTTLDLGDVASFASGLSALNRTIATITSNIPETIPTQSQIGDVRLGNGKDGSLLKEGIFNISSDASGGRIRPDGVLNQATTAVGDSITISNYLSGSYTLGDEVLVFQAKGSSPGLNEFAKIRTITDLGNGSVILGLQSSLINSYDPEQGLFTQRVPNYFNISSSTGLTITAKAWDGFSGGIVAFRAAGTISSNVSVLASGLGFGGGQSFLSGSSYQSRQGAGLTSVGGFSTASLGRNGCGGGNASAIASVFAGGGSYGTSGAGIGLAFDGTTFGTPDVSTPSLGCGGGSGSALSSLSALSKGGVGGGIVLVYANSYTLTGTNFVRADGTSAMNEFSALPPDLGAGGGSGGSIQLFIKSGSISGDSISAIGGAGSLGSSTQFTGHAGGAGRIRINYLQLNGSAYPNFGSGPNAILNTIPAAYAGQF